MDCDVIIKSMKEAGIKDECLQALDTAIREMDAADVHPYMMAVRMVHSASTIVMKALPNEELMHFGKFLRKCADTDMRGSMTKSIINTNGSNENYIPRD